ncbi:unnamed protein product [Paramecium pentaurelia]|uniref:Uncharacterized protein n=1 Tax=Paramecium pentaurelia TaxID=43138 RepID=A0A8S1VHK9_9CILI|nr:unnamed protein product [Paramecium pentaurelia]
MQIGQVVLTTLYFIQGLIVGLPGGAIQVLFAHEKDIGIFSLCTIPWAFKFVWSPIQDYYFIEKFGKRKTYIVPFFLLMGVLLILAANAEHTLLNLFYYYITLMVCLSTSDTAIDGWSVTLLSNVAQQSVCQTFGQQVGWFISQSIFILLNQNNIISFAQYQSSLGIICIIMCILVIFVKETNPDEVIHYQSLFQQIKQVKGLYYNKNLRFLCLFIFLQRNGISFMDIAAPIVMIRAGMEKTFISQAQIFIFCCTFWIPLVIGYFISGKKKENSLVISALTYQTINMAFFLLDYYEYNKQTPTKGKINQFQYLFCFQLLVHEIFKKIFTVCTFSFVAEIVEPQLAGMQISIISSLHNVSRVILDPLVLQSAAYMNIYILVIICVLYQIIVLRRYGDEFKIKQFIAKENWTLHTQDTIDNYHELKEIKGLNNQT